MYGCYMSEREISHRPKAPSFDQWIVPGHAHAWLGRSIYPMFLSMAADLAGEELDPREACFN